MPATCDPKLDGLPIELIQRIAEHCCVSSLISLSLVNHFTRQACYNVTVFKAVARQFSLSPFAEANIQQHCDLPPHRDARPRDAVKVWLCYCEALARVSKYDYTKPSIWQRREKDIHIEQYLPQLIILGCKSYISTCSLDVELVYPRMMDSLQRELR